MFTDFLYILRNYGMKTSLNEWNMLLEALNMDLNHASLPIPTYLRMLSVFTRRE